MYGPLLDGHIRRTNQNLLVLNTVIAGIVLALTVVIWFASQSGKPREPSLPSGAASEPARNLSEKDLLKHPDISTFSSAKVHLKAPGAIDVDWQIAEVFMRVGGYNASKDKFSYHLVPVGERYLLVLPGKSGHQKEFTGNLMPLEERDRNPVQSVVAS